MKPIVCVYYEGNDTKFGVFVKEKDRIKLIKTASVDIYGTSVRKEEAPGMPVMDGGSDIQLDESQAAEDGKPAVFESIVTSELRGIKLAKSNFIPILTEPSVYYHFVTKRTTGGGVSTVTQELLAAEGELKEKRIDRETYGKVEITDGGSMTVYVRQDIACVKMLKNLAVHNKRRVYKIVSIKSAEVSLVNYVAKKKKFFPDDYSLIVYIGKEYSKLIFMQGRKLKHIGSALDIGTTNLHTYDVYFSKILLEMENGGIPTLDNIIVCGEDVSENLILSFYGTFPETNVSRLEFEEIDTSELSGDNRENISFYSIPIAVAVEYFEEQAKQYVGLNLLPRWVKEDQKAFQFAWHGYLMVPLLFGAGFFITTLILQNHKQLNQLDKEINIQTELKNKNLKILAEIDKLTLRINEFGQTQTILDSVSVGTEIWGNFLEKLSNFTAAKKNFWVRSLNIEDIIGAKVEGHSFSKSVLTELTTTIDSAVLRSVNFDPIRDQNTYRYVLSFKVPK